MSFQIQVRIQDSKKVKNLKALAQQLASVLESITGKRTMIEVKDFSSVKR